jgi:hypothetical protein
MCTSYRSRPNTGGTSRNGPAYTQCPGECKSSKKSVKQKGKPTAVLRLPNKGCESRHGYRWSELTFLPDTLCV